MTQEAEQIMKRCQVGTRNYDEANNLHADCYRVIGKLLAEKSMREVQRLGQEIEQEPVYHIRQYGDVTKEQLDRYIETGDINPQPEQELVAIKRMKEWIEYLKRKSDFGQHMKIPSEMSAGTCWELALELEQFINTTPPQRKPLTHDELSDIWFKQSTDWMEFARAIEAAHGIKENT